MQWEHPIYKRIVKPIIDEPVFQRLRDIYQLGMTDKVFPGATHTRFSHSLGCCYIASRIFHKLFMPILEQNTITQETYALLETYTVATSLLHDIGHGPYSHAFEHFINEKFKDKITDFKVDHEKWTPQFLSNELEPVLRSIFKNYPQNLETHTRNIQALITHDQVVLQENDSPLNEWLTLVGDIISSQLDADRMDYLLRDGHFCGVAYGTFDLEWMLNSLTYEKTKKGYRLSITRKGVGAVEHFLAARRLMTQNIYHHLKVKSEEEIMVEFLLKLHEDNLKDLVSKNLFQFLKAIHQIYEGIDKNNSQESEIKKKIIIDAYPFYRKITDFDVSSAVREVVECQEKNGEIQEIQDLAKVLFYRSKWPIAWKLDINRRGVGDIIDKAREDLALKESDWWKLKVIDYPFKMLKTDREHILICDDKQTKLGSNIQSVSEFAKQMGDRPEMIQFLSIHHELIGSETIKNLHIQLLNEQFFALPPPLEPN